MLLETRILFFVHGSSLYGANRSLLNLIDGLQAFPEIVPIVLLQQDGDLKTELDKRVIENHVSYYDFEVYVLRGFSRVKGAMRHVKNLLAQPQINKLVRDIQPDIIHSNNAVIYAGAKAATKLNIPHVWHIREFGKEDYNFAFNWGDRNHRRWLHKSNVIIAISKAIASSISAEFAPKVELLYNGIVNKELVPDQKSYPTSFDASRPFTFCIVGLLVESKGQHQAIEAFALAKKKLLVPIRLVIVGDTPDVKYEQRIRHLVQSHGLDSDIYFEGYLLDVKNIYDTSDVSLMCSRSEGMGRVTVEAMSYGLPVIGYDGGATPELIQHEKSGLVYQSVNELAAFMEALVRQPTLLRKLSAGALARAIDFTQDKYASEYRTIISKYFYR